MLPTKGEVLHKIKLIIKSVPGTQAAYKALKKAKNRARTLNIKDLKPKKSLEQIKQEYVENAQKELNAFLNSSELLVFKGINDFPDKTQKSVSIVIPVYNKDYFTYQCLKNLLKLNSRYLEVIVINNNSNDATNKLLEKVKGIKVINNSENLHFLKASNQGALSATCEYLLFLNNDAIPSANSIDLAVETFETFSNVGAVGGKIVLPDDKLQEAGSIIWKDGTCVGLGRGESPDIGEYNYIREVDFCSGAFLMTTRDLFVEQGLFDDRYSPAYYEECDYCLGLQAKGYKTIYNPSILINHFEFGSSTLSQQAFDLMTKNRIKFVEKNSELLKNKFEDTAKNKLLARDLKKYKGKILYIDERLPQIKTGAGYPRANLLVKLLDELGYFVTVYPLIHLDSTETWDNVRTDIPDTVEVVLNNFENMGLDQASRFRSFYDNRSGFYDAVIVSRSTTMKELRKVTDNLSIFKAEKLIYDAEAVTITMNINERKVRGENVSVEEESRLIAQEIEIAKGCSTISCVSEREAQYYRDNNFTDIKVLSYSHKTNEVLNSFQETKDLLFIGAIHADFTPNADSMVWFVNNVLPLLKKKLPEIKLNIVGINHSTQVKSLASESVKIVGPVESLVEWYQKSRVFIAPTRFSAGIPLKVIESASFGIPCVVSKLLSEQLIWEAGRDYLVANTAEEFSEAIFKLYTIKELWEKINKGSLERIKNFYSEERFKESLLELIGR